MRPGGPSGLLADLPLYVIAGPVQRPTGRRRGTADRLSGPGPRPVQSRSGTGRGMPTLAAGEANEKERQHHSCYDRPHIPRPPVSQNSESLPPRPPALVLRIAILNLHPVFAQCRKDVVVDSGSNPAEPRRKRCMTYSGTFVESEVAGDAVGMEPARASGQSGGRAANRAIGRGASVSPWRRRRCWERRSRSASAGASRSCRGDRYRGQGSNPVARPGDVVVRHDAGLARHLIAPCEEE